MRALVADPAAAGGIAIHDVDEPHPQRGEVIVDVKATSLNRGELNRLRTASEGWRPGWDFAGIVQGKQTRVVGIVAGAAWAERVAVQESWLGELPDSVSFEQAAALPTAALTALRMLRVPPGALGRRVLITGAAGGVGRFAVQLARLGGAAEVTGIARSAERGAGLEALGADRVITSLEQLEGRYDLILESVGGESLATLAKRVTQQHGTLVMFGNSSNQQTTFDVREVYLGGLVRLQSFTCFNTFAEEPPGADLAHLSKLVGARQLDPQVAGVLSWEEMPEALRRLGERTVNGKLVLRIP